MTTDEMLLERAKILKLYGLIDHWTEVYQSDWLKNLIDWEENARSERSLQRRLRSARLEKFKSLIDFDWNWPKKCDRGAIETLMTLEFLKDPTNIILCGPNGVGKSMIACNIAYQAVMQGHTVLFTNTANMLNDLAAQDGNSALRRRIKYYALPFILVTDEVGYLSYSNRHADLLFEIIAQRYQKRSTIVTTNKPFNEWGEIFPNAACVVSIIDRLVHNSEIISIEGDSYRLKEAKEKALNRKKNRMPPNAPQQ